jgi:Holliday junction resolvase-like predicted endonuclease
MKTFEHYEKKAGELLISRGHTLLFTDFRMGRFQADLVTEFEDILFVVEVKYRNSAPMEAQHWVNPQQIYRLKSIATHLLKSHKHREIRILLVGYSKDKRDPEIIPLDVS